MRAAINKELKAVNEEVAKNALEKRKNGHANILH